MKQQLDSIRIATGKEWQWKFGLGEQIPTTVIVDRGRVRVIHDGVMPDPVLFLEADLRALASPPSPKSGN